MLAAHRSPRAAAGGAARALLLLALTLGLACAPAAPSPTSSGPAVSEAAAAPAAASQAAAPAPTAAPFRMRVAYAEPTPALAALWVAAEAGIFARHGLDVDLQYVQSAQTVPAVIGGDIDMAFGGGYAAMSSRLAGSDLLIFYAMVNWYPYEFMVIPSIQGVADLRGQKIGISRFGSSSDVATRLALKHLGLDPDRDVSFVQVGSLPERIAAMQAGALAAGLSGVPDNLRLRKLGFRSLLDLSTMGDEAMINMGYAEESWMRENEGRIQDFVDALVEGVHYTKTNREYTERLIAQYVKLEDPEEVAYAYDHDIAKALPRVGRPSIEEGRKYLLSQEPTDPRAVGANPAEFFDLRYTDRVVSSGLVERLYGKE
ncbi:MAG TPA: ABC transporter substrate-binding protein [Chloroflexota bacterium]|nr:ABC transporter substrate-binding protein [Chloroflexota bacterium]